MRNVIAEQCETKARALSGLLLMLAGACCGGCSESETTLTGIWKSRCADFWGVQIKPAGDALYAITFCGLSGCLEPGTWTPDSSIEGDPKYQVVSLTKIGIRRNDGGYFMYQKCTADPHWSSRPYLTADQ